MQGVAGIFLGASRARERVYVRSRKGYIKLALEAGTGSFPSTGSLLGSRIKFPLTRMFSNISSNPRTSTLPCDGQIGALLRSAALEDELAGQAFKLQELYFSSW